MLVTSIFSFSQNVLYSFRYKFQFLTLSHTSPGFHVSAVKVFRKLCGKRRNCSERAISPFPTVFSNLLESFQSFFSSFKLSSAISSRLKESKICCLGKGHIYFVVCKSFQFGQVDNFVVW